ncbi:MAG TPA: sulfur carrier protein ThiS [Actinophytocola sp.]|nr:sulfur carrier protein ThiS [Actinophytocola sp.]HEV2780736.1 sulfur carrier protein ThiS [Actinophytocola sp.]
MEVRLNGEDTELAEGTTVAGLLAARGIAPGGVAVAVNAEVVPRASHATTVLPDGAVVEVLTAVQGG